MPHPDDASHRLALPTSGEGGEVALTALLGDPERHLEALLGLVTLYIRRGNLAEALRHADRARRLAPGSEAVATLCERLGGRPSSPPDSAPPAPASAAAVLLITLARGGGVARHVAERARALAEAGLRVIELRPDVAVNAGGACRLWTGGQAADQDRLWRLPEDLAALADRLGALSIRRVEIHHILGLGPAALDLPRRLGAPYDLFIHDYSWVCPRITLMAGDGAYCGEPDLGTCEACLATHGPLIEEDISVADLRARSARVMAGAARVVVPTGDVARRLGRYFPSLNPIVAPWEPALRPAPTPRRAPDGLVRVAVMGAIGEHKGYARLLACAEDARRRDLPLDFRVIGYTEDDFALFATGRVFVTGEYQEGEAGALLAREACDVALAASVWPETWCYTLTHLLRAGLPVVAFDIGAMAERLAGVAGARLLPLAADAAAVNDTLLSLRPRDHWPLDAGAVVR